MKGIREQTSREKAIMDKVIRREMLRLDNQLSRDSDALILWVLHTEFGFGKERLLRFWRANFTRHKELCDRYSLGDDSVGWICRKKLIELCGINVDELYRIHQEEKKRDANG